MLSYRENRLKIMMKIDFIVAGAAKSGTTSLYHFLNSHPDIFIPEVKECRFFSKLDKQFSGLGAEYFANEGITEDEEYEKLFHGHEQHVCGDISNDYLYYHGRSIENIVKYVGLHVRIIIILRNPVDRAFSSYMHHIREGWETLDFRKALDFEEQRIKENWGWTYHFKNAGLYSEGVRNYMNTFKNTRIYLYEDLQRREWLINDICQFLNVDPDLIEDHLIKKFNKSGRPRFRFINDFSNGNGKTAKLIKPIVKRILPNKIRMELKQKIKDVNLINEVITNEDRAYLIDYYQEDIKKLETVIQRDLSGWLTMTSMA